MTTSRAENLNYKIKAPPQHCFIAQIPNEYSSAAKSPEQGMTSPGGDKCGPVGDKDGPGSNVPLWSTLALVAAEAAPGLNMASCCGKKDLQGASGAAYLPLLCSSLPVPSVQ